MKKIDGKLETDSKVVIPFSDKTLTYKEPLIIKINEMIDKIDEIVEYINNENK